MCIVVMELKNISIAPLLQMLKMKSPKKKLKYKLEKLKKGEVISVDWIMTKMVKRCCK